jgi:hypothetical protein
MVCIFITCKIPFHMPACWHMKALPILLLMVVILTGCQVLDRLYDSVEITPAVTNEVTGEVTPPTIYLQPKQSVQGGMDIVQTLPLPWVGLGGLILSLAYSIYRNARNKQISVALVQGVEAVRKLLQTPELKPIDDKIKAALIEHQTITGTIREISKLVHDYTTKTTK